MIRVDSLYKNFGGVNAVENVNLDIAEGQITGLIGPNGAGKTTLFNIIAGMTKPSKGKIYLKENDITELQPHQRFKQGMLRTFQIAHEFSTLTVLENLMVVPPQMGENIWNAWFQRTKMKNQEKEIYEKAMEVVQFLKLEHLKDEVAGNLSGGQKKLLELARTMMVEAKVVLLDEVGAGVNKTLLTQIAESILKLKEERNYTFCMIEHDMEFIAKLCDPIIVMVEGKVLMQGNIDEIRQNKKVVDAYLGKRENR